LKLPALALTLLLTACSSLAAPSTGADGDAGVASGAAAGPVDPGLGGVGCASIDADLGQQLQLVLDDQRRKAGALGMNLGVMLGCRTWIGSSGSADLQGERPLNTIDRFRIYSVTKTFTSALVFKLIERGLLQLDDPLANWYPDFPAANRAVTAPVHMTCRCASRS
jgi:CubicO group peptidase (beta-lactamase class C family)